jgi:hypothetical protein
VRLNVGAINRDHRLVGGKRNELAGKMLEVGSDHQRRALHRPHRHLRARLAKRLALAGTMQSGSL